jgi:hypothetical protein
VCLAVAAPVDNADKTGSVTEIINTNQDQAKAAQPSEAVGTGKWTCNDCLSREVLTLANPTSGTGAATEAEANKETPAEAPKETPVESTGAVPVSAVAAPEAVPAIKPSTTV